MFGAYIRFKCNYAALKNSSDNQQQHLFLGQRWTIGNTMWMWLSTSSQRRILNFLNNVYQDFGKFISLRNILTDSRSNMSLSLCLRLTIMKQHLDMCTYKVETQQRWRWLDTVDIAIHKFAGIYWVTFSCFSSISSPILFLVWYYYYLTEKFESVSPKRKRNSIM